jgi:magnesium chelatase family protein
LLQPISTSNCHGTECRVDPRLSEPFDKLTDERTGEPSVAIRERVEGARKRQRQRFADSERVASNGDMGPAEIREVCVLDDAERGLLRAAMQQLQLSARAYHRILKLARTIADLGGAETIETPHLAKAC